MRTSKLFLSTLKENPAEAEIISHKLMLRAGLLSRLSSGIYSWSPLGLLVLKKVENIIRIEMNNIDAQEILMPIMQPKKLWESSMRWTEYGPLLFKCQDNQKREFCLGPTHEEVATHLVKNQLKSYKQLPQCLYQIQTKFRDEIRPRFGVMRAREFLMKDAYSFHLSADCLQNTYEQMYTAYKYIFTKLGLRFRAVLADTGNIGGATSHEFQVLANSGEDDILYSDSSNYAANVELCPTKQPTTDLVITGPELQEIPIPDITETIKQAKYLKVQLNKIIKTFLVQGANPKQPIVALIIRADHNLNFCKIDKLAAVAKPCTFVESNLLNIVGCQSGFIGPINLPDNIPIFADYATYSMANFYCGANQTNQYFGHVHWQRDCKIPEFVDLRNAQVADASPDGQGLLKSARGIEVGHIFQLGTKYSTAMQAQVLNEHGVKKWMLMGCYGIGISRTIAACIEQNHDEKGIVWPIAMAPYEVCLIGININKNENVRYNCEKLYKELKDTNISVLWDDRNEQPGVMFKDMELIGIPHRLVISNKNLQENMIEYQARSNSQKHIIKLANIVSHLKTILNNKD